MQGRRRYLADDGRLPAFAEGDYGKDAQGVWWVRPPRTSLADLDARWTVEEHEDGTISVRPSIDSGVWHGHLTRGEWIP